MKIGLILPTIGQGAAGEVLDAGAGVAARLGWNSVWVTDHLLVPAGPEAEEYGWVLEATTALTWVAARHESLKVGFSVIIPAMRDAPLLAKQIATLDVLTGGRLIVGVGASDKDDLLEYENLGKGGERFERRGAYLDEAIALWRHLWSGRTDPFEGEFHQLRDFVFAPLPPQGESLPIWCGGRSGRALRRAAQLADGYHAAQTGPRDIAEKLPQLRAEAEKVGRAIGPVSVRIRVRFDAGPLSVYSVHGCVAAMGAEIGAFAEAGVDELMLVLGTTDPAALVAAAERFHHEVYIPAVGSSTV